MGLMARATGLLVAAIALSGCIGMQRTEMVEAKPCNADAEGKLAQDSSGACQTAFAEVASANDFHYTIYFAEFDDQGWPFMDKDSGKVQLHRIIDALRDKLHGKGEARANHRCVQQGVATVHLLVFVHGWKHTAAYDDGNVANFRRLTHELAEAECTGAASKREVVGLYIGWRGKSWDAGEPWINISFWDRKSAAADVAQGSVRELFATLDAIVDAANKKATKDQRKPVRMMMVGHSFGGHILLTALGGSVIKHLATFSEGGPDAEDCARGTNGDISRDGDLVVLVNPAIEGTRYHPLHRVAERWRYHHHCYRAPLFVAVTSEGDVATKRFFRLGRLVSTIFEDYESDEQRYSDRSTFGHNEAYMTHELRIAGEPGVPAVGPVEECGAWKDVGLVPRIMREYWNQCHFARDAISKWNPQAPRAFCGGAVLTPIRSVAWRAPVLNIRASRSLIEDHSQIYDQRFVSFLRELYMDTLIQGFEHPLLKGGRCIKPPMPGTGLK